MVSFTTKINCVDAPTTQGDLLDEMLYPTIKKIFRVVADKEA